MMRSVVCMATLAVATVLVGAELVVHYVIPRYAGLPETLVGDALDANRSPASNAQTVLRRYCASCHEGETGRFGFEDTNLSSEAISCERLMWETALARLRAGTMPPRKAPQPSDAERAALIQWIEETIQSSPAAPYAAAPDDDHDLALRLARLLWDGRPDDELRQHAERGTLRPQLESIVRRMLQDRRSQALADKFADFWLGLRKLDAAPGLNVKLRSAMRQETQRAIAYVLREDRSVLEWLDADYTFVNEPLALHYGITGIYGPEMRRIPLRGSERGGLITQAGVLTLMTNMPAPSRVTRGRWVLEHFLGESIGKPPADAAAKMPRSDSHTLRSRDVACQQCHAKIDPFSTALDDFDPLGRWHRHNLVITDTLPDGNVAQGPRELKAYLLKNQAQFIRTLGERLLSYSLGRRLTPDERAALEPLGQQAGPDGYHAARLIADVIRLGWRVGLREGDVETE